MRLVISEPNGNPRGESQTPLKEAQGMRECCGEACAGVLGFDASFHGRAASGTGVAAPRSGKSVSCGVREMGVLYTSETCSIFKKAERITGLAMTDPGLLSFPLFPLSTSPSCWSLLYSIAHPFSAGVHFLI